MTPIIHVASVLSDIPAEEPIVAAYRCGIRTGATENEGVAVLTATRLSVFDRRGLRSVDQQFHLALTTPFSVEAGRLATLVTIAVAGGRPVTLDLLDAARAEAFRDHLQARRSAREEGWWSQVPVAWPGWLGADPSWSYLGGDPSLPGHAGELRMEISPAGVTLGDVEGATAHLSAWSRVSFLHVLGPQQAFQRAAASGLLSSDAFAAAWRSAEWSAFLVLGYATGEQVFLGTTILTEAWLRARLVPVAAAMPGGEAIPAAASDQTAVIDVTADEQATGDDKTPPAAPATHDASPLDLVTQLERIAALHRQGVLDDAEFARAKAALLGA